MYTLKTKKLQDQITSYLSSVQYFVHPPGVAYAAMWPVLIDKRCLSMYCNGRIHLMNNTRELPEI